MISEGFEASKHQKMAAVGQGKKKANHTRSVAGICIYVLAGSCSGPWFPVGDERAERPTTSPAQGCSLYFN
jgi:hypothetical protein